jgi:NAD(P)-dependent dehydrogenase (short-subunit alcohol dehydrogenase family)
MEKFKNKVVVITGGNSGIGYATAKEFIAQAATVIITGKRKDALEKASKEIGAIAILADQSNLQNIDNLVTEVKNSYGKVDVLFLNAGVAFFAPIEFTSEAQFDTMVDTNFKGSFFTLQKFIPVLNDGASVVFLTSGNTALNMPNSSVYSASKSAISHLAKIATKELAPRKIRVNTINPGPTQTEMQSKFGMDEATLNGMKAMIISQVPLAKMGVPEDVAKMVVYLSDDTTSSFITGAEFFIDGGMAL